MLMGKSTISTGPFPVHQVSVQPSLHALCPKARLEALLGGCE